jgi:primosomal protein N' (replication factor Y)
MSQSSLFVEVILPLPLYQTFTYAVPPELSNEIMIGKRVVVQMGNRKLYTGLIYSILPTLPSGLTDIKAIISVLDDEPLVNNIQIKFWEWIARYYMCPIGEVMQMALPAGLNSGSKTFVTINFDFNQFDLLTEKEKQLFSLLKDTLIDENRPKNNVNKVKNILLSEVSFQNNSLSLQNLSKRFNNQNILPILRTLEKKNAVQLSEDIENRNLTAQRTYYIRLSEKASDEVFLSNFLDKLNKAPKQKLMLETFLQLSNAFSETGISWELPLKNLFDHTGVNYSALKGLEKKGILEIFSKSDTDLLHGINETICLPELSVLQQNTLQSIIDNFQKTNVVLLHGVTGSGKTEIYFHLIGETLKKGQEVLYLLPEISITSQMVSRLKEVFGDRVGIYHSRLSEGERRKVYSLLLSDNTDKCKIILGVRSSIFLPFDNLGLIIVDDEHESSYKQFEPAPRYHARDAAIVLATFFNAKVVLGSATPSLESYYNASNGKYGLVKLYERYKGVSLPKMKIVNMRIAKRKGRIQSNFSQILLENMKLCLDQHKQIILFQNRRGFAPYIQCQSCKYIFRCKNCDVSLTYHKNPLQMICHYCGYTVKVPDTCPECGSKYLKVMGFGTEKVEEELPIFFPLARIARMDQDSTRRKGAFSDIVNALEQQQIDILVGTQMITRGFDFPNIGLVGILNADNLLSYPDFRAYERSFQLLVQAGGRSGRKDIQGKVIIQTFMPEHPIIQMALKNDYLEMYNSQIVERKTFKYPPFTRLIYISLRHKNEKTSSEAAEMLYNMLLEKQKQWVLKPEVPIIARTHNLYIRNIFLKIPRNKALDEVKGNILECVAKIKKMFSTLSIIIDVDPQ